MSVIDYKYVNSVNVEQACSESVNLADEIDVRNLKLLVQLNNKSLLTFSHEKPLNFVKY